MKTIAKTTTVFLMTLVVLMSCKEDEIIDNALTVGDYQAESFSDLTKEEVQQMETPYESKMEEKFPSNGRVVISNTNIIIETMLEIMLDAKFIGIKDAEVRGLAAYKIRLELDDDESVIEIFIAKDLFKVLKIRGYSGSFDYAISPGGSFITLEAAIKVALEKQAGEVEYWELELEENNKWEYEIHVEMDDMRMEVEVDATTGAVIGLNKMDDEDEKEFEPEDDDKDEEETKLPSEIKSSLSGWTATEILFAEKEESDDQKSDIWSIYFKTSNGAVFRIEVEEDTNTIVYAKGEEGPFDYDLKISPNYASLKTVMAEVNTEMQSETYYWYFEEIEHEQKTHLAFVIKVKDKNNKYHKIAVDVETSSWIYTHTYD